MYIRAERHESSISKWNKATNINGISLKIGCRPTMSTLTKSKASCPSSSGFYSLSHSSLLISCVACYSLSLSRTLLYLFLGTSLLLVRSQSVKSYLVTARNMLGELIYSFAFTYRCRFPRTRTTRGGNRPAP